MTKKRIPTVDSMLAILAEHPAEAAAFDAATAREYPQAADRREAVAHALALIHMKQDAMNATATARTKNALVKRAVDTIRAKYHAMKPGAERSAYRRANWDRLCRK